MQRPEFVQMPLIDFIRNKERVTNVAYSHSFITQKQQILEEDGTIKINYLGNFHNLNEELIKILTHLGVKKIKHDAFLEKNIIMNKGKEDFSTDSESKSYVKHYTQEILNLVNYLFKEDFEQFNFPIFETLDELKTNFEKITGFTTTETVESATEKATTEKATTEKVATETVESTTEKATIEKAATETVEAATETIVESATEKEVKKEKSRAEKLKEQNDELLKTLKEQDILATRQTQNQTVQITKECMPIVNKMSERLRKSGFFLMKNE